jgi:amidohydrolase family protein
MAGTVIWSYYYLKSCPRIIGASRLWFPEASGLIPQQHKCANVSGYSTLGLQIFNIMRKLFLVVCFFLLRLFTFAQTEAIVIKNVSVVDVKTGQIHKAQTVVIKQNKIMAVSEKVAIPKGAIIVDATSKFLIPGLWDMHAHALTDKRYTYTFPLLVANGVTGIREMANNLSMEEVNHLRKDVESGKMLGPRFGALTFRLLDGPGTQFANVAVVISTPQQGREIVKTYKQSGADFIKPYNLLSREVYLAIVDEAKKQKIPVEGHVPFSMTAAEVSILGQKSIEHDLGILVSCSRNETELRQQTLSQPSLWGRLEAKAGTTYDTLKAHNLFKQFVRNGTWSCPTTVLYRASSSSSDSVLMEDTALEYIPQKVRTDWHETFVQRIMKAVPEIEDRKIRYQMRQVINDEMHRYRVPLLAGTDFPNPYAYPGFSLHDELELFVEAGLSPLEALQTATINPAIFLGKGKEWGSVEKGKIADLVLLNANPLENISNTKKIFAVIVNGRLLQRSDLDNLLRRTKDQANR